MQPSENDSKKIRIFVPRKERRRERWVDPLEGRWKKGNTTRAETEFLREAQPLNWSRAIWGGALASFFMMCMIDTFAMIGYSNFSLEVFIGSMLRRTDVGTHNWTVGFIANLILGSVFGCFYAYFFEYIFGKANPRIGTKLGFGHAILAAIVLFPFWGMVYNFMGLTRYRNFGFFGSGLGIPTVLVLFFSHVFFGTIMGLSYGPVGTRRVTMSEREPGDVAGRGDYRVIDEEFDSSDRTDINW